MPPGTGGWKAAATTRCFEASREVSVHPLALPFTPRFIVLTLCIAVTILCIGAAAAQGGWLAPLSVPIALFGGLSVLGVHDLVQKRHAVLRNYPISAHLRFLLEE